MILPSLCLSSFFVTHHSSATILKIQRSEPPNPLARFTRDIFKKVFLHSVRGWSRLKCAILNQLNIELNKRQKRGTTMNAVTSMFQSDPLFLYLISVPRGIRNSLPTVNLEIYPTSTLRSLKTMLFTASSYYMM